MTQIASLHTSAASLILELRDGEAPAWRHFGPLASVEDLPKLAETRGPASFSFDQDVPLALVPTAGLGWFGPTSVAARRNGHNLLISWTSSEVEKTENTLTIRLADEISGVALEQTITANAAFQFSTKISNLGTEPLTLDRLCSVVLPLPSSSEKLLSWRGRHNAELFECLEQMPQHTWQRETRRGISGHGGAPGVFALGQGAQSCTGPLHGVQLCWSGDSRIAVERDDEGCWVLTAEAVLAADEVTVMPGQSWSAPDALAVFSCAGRNGASTAFHAATRAILQWPRGRRSPRKVHLNSWEACYFDHDADRIAALAESAAAIGIERFVLDDGWFRGRNDDTAGLGDWTTDPLKYPEGLGPLANRITALGMEFGLWVEPEMINPNSDLYRDHPDWALSAPGRPRPTARNQLVLDMRRADVRDYLFGCIDALLRDLPIGYLKWDHNRDLAPAGGAAQVLGTYDLMRRIRAAHPMVEIEACAGGGGRSDVGFAPYVHRYWASDNIDAVSRIDIQRGFLAFLPPEVMGCHVGASPAHATDRSQSLAFRAAVAMPGHFGVEMDPRTLTDPERVELADWIAFHKDWRDLLHGGQVWLGEGPDGLRWHAQGRADSFLLFAMRAAPPLDRRPQPLPLPFLADAGRCSVRLLRLAASDHGHAAATTELARAMAQDSVAMSGAWLAANGLPLPPMKAESVAIFHVEVAA